MKNPTKLAAVHRVRFILSCLYSLVLVHRAAQQLSWQIQLKMVPTATGWADIGRFQIIFPRILCFTNLSNNFKNFLRVGGKTSKFNLLVVVRFLLTRGRPCLEEEGLGQSSPSLSQICFATLYFSDKKKQAGQKHISSYG